MALKKGEILKCEICGNIVEGLHSGTGVLVCCGKDMVLKKENSVDAALEKHVPFVSGNLVKVGAILHPMEEKHYIEWIEGVSEDGKISRIFLKPGELPEYEFPFVVVKARAYCNLHGLWINSDF